MQTLIFKSVVLLILKLAQARTEIILYGMSACELGRWRQCVSCNHGNSVNSLRCGSVWLTFKLKEHSKRMRYMCMRYI